MIAYTIQKEFAKAKKWGWDKIYVFCDLHETFLKPNWDAAELTHDYYPHAKEFLQELSARQDVCLIMHTCSHPHQIEVYLQTFKQDGIHFTYINENPEIRTNSRYGFYEKKPYCNILFDDKAGFHPGQIPVLREEFKKYTL